MASMNRRSLLFGMLSIPALKALGGTTTSQLKAAAPNAACSKCPPPTACGSNAPNAPDDRFLNIAFHGTWIYLLYDDHIDAIAPNLGSGHLYGTSDSSEDKYQTLAAGEYQLENISECRVDRTPVLPPPDAGRNAVLDWKLSKITGLAQGYYYKIKLPIPDQMCGILPFRYGPVFKTANSHVDDRFNRSMVHASVVQAFVYQLKPTFPACGVRLESTDGTTQRTVSPPANPKPHDDTYNFHVLATVNKDNDDVPHEHESFCKMVSLLQGLDLCMDVPACFLPKPVPVIAPRGLENGDYDLMFANRRLTKHLGVFSAPFHNCRSVNLQITGAPVSP